MDIVQEDSEDAQDFVLRGMVLRERIGVSADEDWAESSLIRVYARGIITGLRNATVCYRIERLLQLQVSDEKVSCQKRQRGSAREKQARCK